MEVVLREIQDSDLPVFYRHMSDPEAVRMAALTPGDPADPDVFNTHWQKIRSSSDVLARTVLADGDVVGSTAGGTPCSKSSGEYGEPGEREVTYWIDRAYRGRGVATAALRGLLAEVPDRPLYARAAADNAGSLRVLHKCGFRESVRARGYANARGGAEIDEVVLTLEG